MWSKFTYFTVQDGLELTPASASQVLGLQGVPPHSAPLNLIIIYNNLKPIFYHVTHTTEINSTSLLQFVVIHTSEKHCNFRLTQQGEYYIKIKF